MAICDLVFLPQAADDLNAIADYLARTLCAPGAAAGFLRELRQRLETVRRFPDSGPLIRNEYVSDKTLRKLIVGHYVAFYRAEPGRIVVVRVLYGMRNFEELL